MKRGFFTPTIIILTVSLLSTSCTGSSEKTPADNKLGRLEVEIPVTLRDKPEIVAYIHDMNKIVDDYAMLIDQVLTDLGGFENKDMENLGVMDKIRLMKVSTEVGFKSIDIMSKWSDYHDKVNFFMEDLTEDETLAFESVLKRFEERMNQIEKKHAKFFKDKN